MRALSGTTDRSGYTSSPLYRIGRFDRLRGFPMSLIDWSPRPIDWAPMTKQPERQPEEPTFKLTIHCVSAEQRDQIKAELEKYSIRCTIV